MVAFAPLDTSCGFWWRSKEENSFFFKDFDSNPKFSAAHLLHQRHQSKVAPLTLTLLWCHLSGATLAPVLSAFELVVIVVASHWMFGLGLLMTEHAEQKLVARVGAGRLLLSHWHGIGQLLIFS